MKRSRLISATLMLQVLALACSAQWSNNAAVNNAVCTAATSQMNPTSIPDGSGGVIVTWQDARSGNNDIYAQKINAYGVTQWTANGVLICGAANGQLSPVLTSDGSGGAIITWNDFRGGATYDIYAQRINSAGAVQWTANGVAICTAANSQQYPSIISDGSGGAVITWQDARGASNDIYAQRINSAGTVQWMANGKAICTATNSQIYPKIASDGTTGGSIITWADLRGGSTYDVYAQRVNASGVVQWTANGLSVCSAGNSQMSPTIVSDASNGAVITWQDKRSGTNDIYAQRVNGSGAAQWTANGVVICNATNNQITPFIVSNTSSGAIIVWSDYRNGSNYDIYAQMVNSAGAVQWTANGKVICNAANHQQDPTISADGNGGAVIAWKDLRAGTTYNIYAQRVNSAGTVQWVSNGRAVCSAANDQLLPTISSDNTGGAFVAWYDLRGGSTYDIYAQRVNPTGLLCTDPQVNLGTDVTQCGGTVLLDAGNPSSTYLWNTSATTQTITASSTSTYSVTVTATSGCYASDAINVTINPTPSATGVVTNVTCNGGANGAIDLTPSGGTAPYTFVWTPSGQTTEDRTSLTATTYSVVVTDNNGCTFQTSFPVTQPTALSVAMSRTNTTCSANDGTATATPSGGTAPYTYLWNNGQTTQTATGLAVATYSCTVTDNNGCSTGGSIFVNTNGCVPNTQLNPASCGITETALNQVLNCIAVSGANDYQYQVNGPNVTNFSYTRGNNLTSFYMTWVTGVQYGATYTVKVRAKVGSTWGFYSTACNVTTPASIPANQLASGSCGITESSLSQVLNCNAIPGATDYQYRVNGPNVATNFIYTRGSSLTTFYMTFVTGAQYGATYSIEVRTKVGNVWSAYGPVCTVTTPAFPTTQLASGSCGATLSAINQVLNCNAVGGADNYQYKVNGPNVNNYLYTRGSSLTTFYMSSIPGVQTGTYTVLVRAHVGGVWGSYGPSCTVTTPLQQDPNWKTSDPDEAAPSLLSLSVFPNPNHDKLLNFELAGMLHAETVTVEIFDMYGKRVHAEQIGYDGDVLQIKLDEDQPQGFYSVRISTSQGPVFGKVVIE